MRRGDDEGTVLVLTLGLLGVLLALVGVVVDVSAAALARRSLASAADGAAVYAAQQPDERVLSTGDLGEDLPLDPARVEVAVADYATSLTGVGLQSRVEGGTTVVVEAVREVRLPFSGWLGVGHLRITAESRARSPLR